MGMQQGKNPHRETGQSSFAAGILHIRGDKKRLSYKRNDTDWLSVFGQTEFQRYIKLTRGDIVGAVHILTFDPNVAGVLSDAILSHGTQSAYPGSIGNSGDLCRMRCIIHCTGGQVRANKRSVQAKVTVRRTIFHESCIFNNTISTRSAAGICREGGMSGCIGLPDDYLGAAVSCIRSGAAVLLGVRPAACLCPS